MRIEQLMFGVVVLAGLWYFSGRKRQFDFFALAFFASLIYFLPGFVDADFYGRPLEWQAYLVYVTVISAIVVGAVAAERLRKPRALLLPYLPVPSQAALVVTIAAAWFVLVFVLLTAGVQSLLVPKNDSGIPGIVSILWRTTASIALLTAFLSRSRVGIAAASLPVLASFISADRTTLAMIFLAGLVDYLRRKGDARLVLSIRPVLLPVMLAAALLWFGKGIHAGVQVWNSTGSLSASIEPIRSLLAIRGKEVVMRSEPAVTQMILNEIVRTDYYIGPGHLKGVVYQVWPAPSMFGVSSGEFNEIFQADLFPQFRSGLAYNYWAEGMATGGWFMLLAFTALFIMGLLIINALSESPRLSVRCLALLCGAYWAFYIHRNSLGNIIAYERHLLYVGVTLFAIARLIPQKRVWHSMPASSYQENDREFEYFERAFQSDRSGHTAGESL